MNNESAVCALAETHFRVEVKSLECVKYELDKISNIIASGHSFLRGLMESTLRYISWYVGKVHTTRWYSGLGILSENPLKSHTHCLPRVWTTLVVVGF